MQQYKSNRNYHKLFSTMKRQKGTVWLQRTLPVCMWEYLSQSRHLLAENNKTPVIPFTLSQYPACMCGLTLQSSSWLLVSSATSRLSTDLWTVMLANGLNLTKLHLELDKYGQQNRWHHWKRRQKVLMLLKLFCLSCCDERRTLCNISTELPLV